ncbi:branched-chain amino acid ABC transporter permease [Paraburkholderia sp. MMS20-SJTR3]|uniref:Branched-chain amino acid ABC transporter permease n=1 Tax=Paraburkholderia sejongensis TaxID=2886946 RepID=A0ABS8K1E2_9BURK|nr:branched-chain amino acid ABC transporter permease [Paraburkholderia sp. MMS20-SJTR3]MCC8395939.1 branched-chain amino acid ABC transporter permease [Paraburkholderia sp. MMS20-SJTR3]
MAKTFLATRPHGSAPGASWPQRLRWPACVAVLVALALVPLLSGGGYTIELLSKVMIVAIFALSLQLLVGCTGMVSLGHAAFFGAGAYTTALLAPEAGAANLLAMLAVSAVVALLLALIIGALVLRTRGIYFIMVTLAFAQMLYYLVHDGKGFGGSDGSYIYFKPVLGVFGWKWLDTANAGHFYWCVLAVLVATVALLQLTMRSRFGHALTGIKHNEQRMTASGYPVFFYKLASFAIGGSLAGIAGSLYAFQYGYVNPELFSWRQSGDVLLMVILGGSGFGGAITGALAFVLLSDWLAELTKHWQLLFGVLIIVAVAGMPHGISGFAATLCARFERGRAARGGSNEGVGPDEESAA